MFEITAKDSKARTGRLHTLHGIIETPCFLPVATKAAVKHINQEQLKETKTEAFISNSLILYLTNYDAVKEQGIHKFMNWDKVIFTDSGGFQILKEGFLLNIVDNGVIFRSPFNGNKLLLTPKQAIEIQNNLAADVIMALDDVPAYTKDKDNYERVKESMIRTHKWAKICKENHKKDGQLLFGICQGGIFPELRKESAEFISSIDFDGIALGGLCIGESKELMYQMVDISTKIIPENKPRYLMGVGSPEDLLESIDHGIDIFDSAFPTQNARHGTIFTWNGKLRIAKQENKNQFTALDNNCKCYVCKQYTRAYLHYLFRIREPLAMSLLSFHNLYFIHDLLERTRKAIREKDFDRFKKWFLEGYKR